jgi:LacI family transcriptional regulator
MDKIRRIGVAVDLVGAYGRGIFMGLRKYAQEVDNWHCRFCSVWLGASDTNISGWEVDGWIGYGQEPSLLAALQARPRPLVCVSTAEAGQHRPTVAPDNKAIGKMAFEYLLDRGHIHFAFVGYGSQFSEVRQTAFVEAVHEFDRKCHLFPQHLFASLADSKLRQWLMDLPKPVGILCGSDHVGAVVLDCCREMQLAVPQSVAVLSVDNDELYCTARVPSLSSIQLNTFRIGYEAAAILDRMLNGEIPPSRPLLIPPLYVVARKSTDALAFVDDEVRRAVQFIRDRVAHPTTVADVFGQATVSAATIESRFRSQLRSTILRYIHKVHVEHAMSLLTSGNDSIAEVARASGFSSLTRMGIIFRRITGRTPSEYRRQAEHTREILVTAEMSAGASAGER